MGRNRRRRARGTHGISFDQAKKLFIGTITAVDGRPLGNSPVTGKPVRVKVSGKSKTACQRAIDAKVGELRAGVKTSASYTVQDAIDTWADTLTVAPKTAAEYVNSAMIVAEHLGLRTLVREVTAGNVKEALALAATTPMGTGKYRAQKTLAHATAKTKAWIAEADLGEYVRPGVATKVAALDVPKAQGEGRPTLALSLEEMHLLLEAALASGSFIGPMAVLSLCDLGIRPEEARALRWGYAADGLLDINDSVRTKGGGKGCVTRTGGWVKTSKSERFGPMTEISRAALAAWKARQEADGIATGDDDLVFTTKAGKPLSGTQVNTEFKRLLTAAGLDAGKYVPYSLRHTFGMIARQLGVPTDDVSDAMGHSRAGSTTAAVYLNHATQAALDVITQKMNAEFPAAR